MSVLIKNMEMPESCDTCFLSKWDTCNERFYCMFDDCPLIEVPAPHGRLIDADVLKQHIDKLPALPDGNFAGNHSALKALINMQPTVQPEIIHCSECAFPYIRGKNMYCDHITGEEIMVWKDEYCSWAERRTDG